MIQAIFDSKLLMYFILIMGSLVTMLMIIFFIQNFMILDDIQKNTNISNQTQTTINQTKLFLTQQQHEDEAREKQNQIQMKDRSNQTRVILNNTQDLLEAHHNALIIVNEDLKKYIGIQNNTTLKLFKEIAKAQEQNRDIMQVLLNTTNSLNQLQQHIEKNSSDTNVQVSKWGPENNVLGKAILEKLGVNATEILQRDLYSNQTLKDMIIQSPPPPPLPPKQNNNKQ